MAILKYLVVVAALALAACERDPSIVELGDEHIIVHAMLLGGADSVRVVVSRGQADTTRFSARPLPVTNASVVIRSGDQVISLQKGGSCLRYAFGSPDDSLPFEGCYVAAVPGGIRNDTRYDLEVDVPGFASVTGTTVVPSAIAIVTPLDNQEVEVVRRNDPSPVAPFTTAWIGVPANGSVRVQLIAAVPRCALYLKRAGEPGFLIEGILRAEVDESPSLIAGVLDDCQSAGSRFNGKLVVTAFDPAYESYLASLDESQRLDEAAVGLTGAFGFFGSAASASRPVTLVTN